MAKRIQETKQYMIQLTDNQLELTTKRTIMENEQMSAEMAYQSHQTSSVLSQNLELERRTGQLKRELSLSRDTQDELSKRNLVYQRAIKHLVRCYVPSYTLRSSGCMTAQHVCHSLCAFGTWPSEQAHKSCHSFNFESMQILGAFSHVI